MGDMLRRIQTLAAASSLNVRYFKPQPVTNKELHAEWPMQLEFDGNYHDLGLFFDKVAKVPRIINISGINIKAKDAKAAVETSTTVTAQVTATTFVLLDKPAGAPGKPGNLEHRARRARRNCRLRTPLPRDKGHDDACVHWMENTADRPEGAHDVAACTGRCAARGNGGAAGHGRKPAAGSGGTAAGDERAAGGLLV